jgi:ribosomal protein S18 acetylase RimI-like enzyme
MTWVRSRIARPVRDLDRSAAFYGTVLGLRPGGGFRGHDGYDGAFFELPGGGELELTSGPTQPVPGSEEDLLVLYLPSAPEVAAVAASIASAGVRQVSSPNPYWNRHGRTFLDPDGHRVVVALAFDRTEAARRDPKIHVGWHHGSRVELRGLFELAEDSQSQLDAYLDAGRVLVAGSAGEMVGHLQLVTTGRPDEIELKNMAVRPDQQGRGIGRALVEEAVARSADDGYARMIVATAAADIGNLRFYQRTGFRLERVEPDAFVAATGYPLPIDIDGIPLLDRVWLARPLGVPEPDA